MAELAPDEEIIPIKELPAEEEVVPVGSGRELGSHEDVFPDRGSGEEFARGAAVGAAGFFGAPVDAVNAALGAIGLGSQEPFMGSKNLQRGLSVFGIAPSPDEPEPDTLAGSAGKMVGTAAGALIPIGVGARAVTAGVEATTSLGKAALDIAKTALTSPKMFAAGEVASAVAAGAGGYTARQAFPDSHLASLTGELLGGLTPTAALTAIKYTIPSIAIRYARQLSAEAVEKFTPAGGRQRAEVRVQAAARHPGKAAEAMGEEVLPEANLTPAQKTKDVGLLSMEKAIIESSDELKGQADSQIAEATKAIRDSLSDLGGGVPVQRTEETLTAARTYLNHLLETRVKIAVQRADERLAELGPKATREEANILAREELERALSAARESERGFYAQVPKDLSRPTVTTQTKFQTIVAGTPRAQQEDIPEIAARFLDPKSKESLGSEAPFSELFGLRSKLLEEARTARANGKYNTARIADELADSILDDLGAARGDVKGSAGAALRTALDHSFDLNERFTRGTVARILGTEKRGGFRTPEELTLEKTTGVGGPRARVETKALLDAADTPQLRGAVEDFLLDEFQRRAIRGEEITTNGVVSYMSRYRDVLNDFPDLRIKIEAAVRANDSAIIAQNRAEGLARRLNDPKISRAAIFLKEPIDKGIERVVASSNPGKTMGELIKQASRDETGDAVQGLKTAFGNHILDKASTRKVTEADDFIVSGRALKNLLEKGPTLDMAKAIFTPDELKRLGVIAETAERLELSVAAKADKGGVIMDSPSLMVSVLARVTGASFGRKVAEVLGGGTVQHPGIFSNLFQTLAKRGVQDPAKKILLESIKDDSLFKALLTDQTVISRPQEEFVQRSLNAWVAGLDKTREEE